MSTADAPPASRPGARAQAAQSPAGVFAAAVYADAAGRTSPDPLALLPSRPVVDLAGLAALVSSPALELEFMPASPWRGLTLHRPCPAWPAPRADPAELRDRFSASVERCMPDAETVAVFFSGGLDSLAVLMHATAIARRRGTRVVAITVDLTDDHGVQVAGLARGLIADLVPGCEHIVLGTDPHGLPEPPWRPEGPYLHGLPRLNRAANDAALGRGAAVMLTGTGGDELFMAPDYLAVSLARARRWSALSRYLRDICSYFGPGRGLTREGLAALAPLTGSRGSFFLYAGVQMPALGQEGPAGVIHPDLRSAVTARARTWLAERAERQGRLPWCVAQARDMVYPFDPVPGYGPVPERSPYMDPAFSWYAAALPPAAAYSAAYRLPYHRHKALVAGLMPPGVTSKLPAGKQQFAEATRRYFAQVRSGRRLAGIARGLFSEAAPGWIDRDPRLAPVCHAMDTWLEAALTAGATIG